MGFSGCRDHVFEVVDEGVKVFSQRYVVNEDRYAELEKICDLVDSLIGYCDAEYFDVEVDEITTQLRISVACDEVVFYNRDNAFFELTSLVNAFSFSKEGGEDRIVITLKVDDVWGASNG